MSWRRAIARKSEPTRIAIAAALACATCGLACGSSPPPRRDQPREVILHSEDVDRKVGEDAAQEVRAQLGLIEDEALLAYLAEVGDRLARNAPQRRFDYRFAIVDQDAPNAFALPGGHIFVSRGLLTLANSEDELAGVLGHEIVHVASRHAAARQEVARSLPALLDWLQGAYLARYGRDQEREADRLGQSLAASAGYDPSGIVAFLRELENTERLKLGTSRLPGFWDTHPSTQSRVAEAGARANMTPWKRNVPVAATRGEFLGRMEGLAVGARASEGVFIDDRFLHADLDLYVHFPPGWTTHNTHRAVGAIAPNRDAQIFLEIQRSQRSIEGAAGEYVAELSDAGFRVEGTQALQIGANPAFRVDGLFPHPAGGLRVALTWIERDQTFYRFTAVAPEKFFSRYSGAFRNVPRSLRALKPSERAKIRENRMRVAVALQGENLRELSERTGNRWDIQQTAVMNDLFTDRILESGQLVKIAVAESYQPEPDATASE